MQYYPKQTWFIWGAVCVKTIKPATTVFGHLDETASAATALGTTNLCKCTTFCKQELLIAFLNEMDICTQATPLLAFLKRDKLHC